MRVSSAIRRPHELHLASKYLAVLLEKNEFPNERDGEESSLLF